MRSWKSRHLIAKPERSTCMLKSVHRRGQSWAGGLRVELRVDDFRLLRERQHRDAEQECGESISVHGVAPSLFVQDFEHVVGSFLAVHDAELLDEVLLRLHILFSA